MGILDSYFNDPTSMALLGMAGALASSGGASRLPVSTGQVLGNGIQGATQGYKQALENQQASMSTQMQRANFDEFQREMENMRQQNSPPPPSGPTSAQMPPQYSQGSGGGLDASVSSQPGLKMPSLGSTDGAGLDASGVQTSALGQSLPGSAGSATPAGAASSASPPGSSSVAGLNAQFFRMRGLLADAQKPGSGAPYFDLALKYDPNAAASVSPLAIEMRNANIDPNSPDGYAYARARMGKELYTPPVSLRGPAYQTSDGQIHYVTPQAPPGFKISADGQSYEPIGGGTAAVTGAAAATGAGQSQNDLVPVFDQSTGSTRFVTRAQMVASATGAPPVGPAPASSTQSSSMSDGALLATLSPQVQQLYMASNPAQQQALMNAVRASIMGQKYDFKSDAPNTNLASADPDSPPTPSAAPAATAATRPTLLASPPPGYVTGQDALAASNTKRFGALVDAAADSPMRVNVLDNVLGLSQAGVATGPTADWTNKIKGVVAGSPFLSSALPSWQGQVSDYQELTKFLNQNGLRAWQAAGGSGTDAQLDAALHANPNSAMFPQALQTVARWSKAGELALQGKANAQQSWFQATGRDPTKQDQFESAWRGAYDPRAFQFQLMAPQEQTAFVKSLGDQAPAFRQKLATLTQMGAIQ